jgi:hypothetical protein
VQTTVLGAIGLLLYNTRRDEALHYLLSQNYLNDLLASLDAAALAAGGEEVGLFLLLFVLVDLFWDLTDNDDKEKQTSKCHQHADRTHKKNRCAPPTSACSGRLRSASRWAPRPCFWTIAR